MAANTDCLEVRRMLAEMSDDDANSAIVFPDVSAAAMDVLVRALYTGRLEAPSELRTKVMEAVALFKESLKMLKAFTEVEDEAPTPTEDSTVEKDSDVPEREPEDNMVIADVSEKIQVDDRMDKSAELLIGKDLQYEKTEDVPEVAQQKSSESSTPQTREDPGSTTPTTQRSKRNRSAVKRFIELDDDDFGRRKRKRSENKPLSAAATAVKVEDTSQETPQILPKMANRPDFAEAARGEWRQMLSLSGPLEFLRWLLDNGFLNSAVGPCEECSTPLELTSDPDAPHTDKIRWSCPNRSKSRR